MDLGIIFIAHSRFTNIEKNLNTIANSKYENILISIYIDGPTSKKVYHNQNNFIEKYSSQYEIFLNQKNLGVRKFIPYAIDLAFSKNNNLIIIEDDIIINSVSIQFVLEYFDYLNNNIISLFNPSFNSKSNISSFEGGIWGWAVSKEIWNLFSWSSDSLLSILLNTNSKLGLVESLFYSPLIYLSSRGKIKSWAYNWFYIRLKNNIKSIIPSKSLSCNVGIGSADATNTKREHVHSRVICNENYSNQISEEKLGILITCGYSFYELFIRILYHWTMLIFKRKLL